MPIIHFIAYKYNLALKALNNSNGNVIHKVLT